MQKQKKKTSDALPMAHNVVLTPIDELLPYAANARTHSADQVKRIAASIKEFGFNNPILVDGAKGVIAGHGRLEAAKKLKLGTVPVIELAHLTDAQKRAYILADNRLALDAGWDDATLAVEMKRLQEDAFDLGLTGFSQEEIDKLLGGTPVTEGLTDEDEVPEDAPAVCQRGQVWKLGRHRLMCGDSTGVNDVELLMDGAKADLVFTDPPYRVETQGGCKGRIGAFLRKQGKDIEFISEFDPKAFFGTMPLVFASKKMNAYVFCNKDLLPDYLTWARDSGYSFNVLIWKKPCAIPLGDSHRADIEYMLLFRRSAIWNNGLKDANYSRCLEFGRESGLHPTMKPVSLISNELLISSNQGSVVVDFFGGSGSTLIACEKTGRTCFMMELDEKYCDVIIARWEAFTGLKAELIQ